MVLRGVPCKNDLCFVIISVTTRNFETNVFTAVGPRLLIILLIAFAIRPKDFILVFYRPWSKFITKIVITKTSIKDCWENVGTYVP